MEIEDPVIESPVVSKHWNSIKIPKKWLTIAGTIFVFLFLAIRIIQFISLNNAWNNGDKKIRKALVRADKIQVIHDFNNRTVIAEITSKPKIQRMLELIEFENQAPISFWRIPMLAKDFSPNRSFRMDHTKVWFFEGNTAIGYFWIVSKRRTLTYQPYAGENVIYNNESIDGKLEYQSFINVSIWFLEHGYARYIRSTTRET